MRRRGRVNREWFVPSFNFDQRRRSSLYTYLHVGYKRKSVSETSTQGRQSSFSRSEIHPIVSHVECRMQARKSWSLVLELFRRDLGSSAPLDPDCGVGRTVLCTYGVHVAVCRHRGLLVSTIIAPSKFFCARCSLLVKLSLTPQPQVPRDSHLAISLVDALTFRVVLVLAEF